MPVENAVGTMIVAAAMKVHSVLGPGLLESAYRRCLAYELQERGAAVKAEAPIAFRYERPLVENAYRADLIVDDSVIIEIKAVQEFLPVHRSQLVSYLRLGGFKLGYLLNFHSEHMRNGIKRLVNGL